MNDFRCSNCNRLLGKIEGRAEIKCPRCNTMNIHTVKAVISGDRTFQDIEDSKPMSKEEFDRGTVISTGYQDWRQLYK